MPPLNILGFWNRVTKFLPKFSYNYKNKIVITGGSGRFGSELKKINNKYKIFFPNKHKLNILNLTIFTLN